VVNISCQPDFLRYLAHEITMTGAYSVLKSAATRAKNQVDKKC